MTTTTRTTCDLAEAVRVRMAMAGWSHADVCEATGWSQQRWRAYRTADNPTLNSLRAVACVLCLPVSYLLTTKEVIASAPMPPADWLERVSRDQHDEPPEFWELLTDAEAAGWAP